MTREHAKELLPVMTAWANGETVQFHANCGWQDVTEGDTLAWSCALHGKSQMRIKPKPPEVDQ